MRYEITAYNKNNKKDIVYIKTNSQVEATIREWELRMSGYNTKIIINEK